MGAGHQALLALDDRLLIINAGWMAGATFGSKVNQFPYTQVTGVELTVGPMTGVKQIQTPSFQGAVAHGYWNQDANRDPWKLPNCLPVARAASTTSQPYLEQLRAAIALGRWPNPQQPEETPGTTRDGVSASLAQVAELHRAGALTDEEFAEAKRKILG